MLGALQRKLITFCRSPIAATRAKLRSRMTDRARRAMQQAGLMDLFAARPKEAIPPDYADLWMLYDLVRRQRPRTILEFGSGCSTFVMTQALLDNARDAGNADCGMLYSAEADERWADATERSLPERLRPACRIIRSRPVDVDYEGVPAVKHETVPDVVPDFVYLDGPALLPPRLVAIDLLALEEKFPRPFTLVVDGRWANVAFLEKHFRRRYRVRKNTILNNSVFELVE